MTVSPYKTYCVKSVCHSESVLIVRYPDELGRLLSPERIGLQEGVDDVIVVQHLAGEVEEPGVAAVVLEGGEPHQPVQPGGQETLLQLFSDDIVCVRDYEYY